MYTSNNNRRVALSRQPSDVTVPKSLPQPFCAATRRADVVANIDAVPSSSKPKYLYDDAYATGEPLYESCQAGDGPPLGGQPPTSH